MEIRLNIMLNICLNYAARFDVPFNNKNQPLVFKSRNENIPIPEFFINGTKVKAVSSINHLGHMVHENILFNNASKCVKDFYIQFNFFMSDFRYLGSDIRSHLFLKYCTAFYGSQFLPVYDTNIINKLSVAWRTTMKKVWRVPWTTHSNI